MKIQYVFSIILLLVLCEKVNAQYDLYGIWARKAGIVSGNESSIGVSSMITDSKGNTYVYGQYRGTVSLSDNTCNLLNSEGYPYTGDYISYINNSITYSGLPLRNDGYLSKYDDNGEWKWTVRLVTSVADAISGIALADNEQSLVFLGVYGNHSYSSLRPASNSCKIIFGDGTETILPYSIPYNTFANAVLCKVSVDDGTEIFSTYLGYGSGTSTAPNYLLYFNELYASSTGDIFVEGEIGKPHDSYIDKFNSSGTLIDSKRHPDQSYYDIHARVISRNRNTSNFYALELSGTGVGNYDRRIIKMNCGNLSKTYLSHISRGNYGDLTIGPRSLDVNNAETHLFVTGVVYSQFTIQSTGQSSNWKGADDGVIICYNPQNTNAATNIRWIVNLNSTGNEGVTSCKFDEAEQVLHVTGYVNTAEVDFNPLGTAMKRRSTNQQAIFYAVYDLNGICQHVDIIETTTGTEVGYALDVNDDNISLFGTFTGSPFQADPSDRLEPMRTTQSSTFLAKYSTNPLSNPAPQSPASYSAANNLKSTYGVARHEVMTCISLGTTNNPVDYNLAGSYSPKDYGSGTENPNYGGLVSTHINTPDKGMSIKVNARNEKNSPAYLAAWIDFNGNGIFDSIEVSEVITIPANTTITQFDLKWLSFPEVTKANQQTFLRIRLTSEELDGTWSAGNAADGEVEDYRFNLNLLDLDKVVDKSIANVGDTLTYTISMVNKVTGNIELFDPLPIGTKFISASNSGSYGSINFYGNTVDGVKWNFTNLSANTTTTLTIKVVITDKPGVADSIVNIAFAVMHGDTIPSTGTSCNLAETAVKSLWANKDYIAVWQNDSVQNYPISANDVDPNRNFTRDSILWVREGTATLTEPREGTLNYKTKTDYLGLDSLGYRVKTPNDSVDTEAYIAVIKTEAMQYYACPGARITIRLTPKTNSRISYEWYRTLTGGTSFENADTASVMMGNNDTIVYVQVKIDGNIASPRLPVVIYLSSSCGGVPVDCAVDGTVIWEENFGGKVTDPERSSTPLGAGIIDYIFCNAASPVSCIQGEGHYAITKKSIMHTYAPIPGGIWHAGYSDHTSENDITQGYMLQTNAGWTPGKFYEYQIDGLCGQSDLYFSVWLANMCKAEWVAGPKEPDLKFELTDLSGNVLATYYTGTIPRTTATEGLKWGQYGFEFNIGSNSSVIMRIYNNGEGGNGNDIAIDDIQIRLCAPPVKLNITDADTVVCSDARLEIKGEYTDDNTFGTDLTYRWEYLAEGAANWSTLIEKDTTVTVGTTLKTTYVIDPAKKLNEGYYRLLVTRQGNINMVNCRASSDSIFVRVVIVAQVPDIRVHICPDPIRSVYLTSYLDSLDFTTVKWTEINSMSPHFVAGTDVSTGELKTADFGSNSTYTYTYKLSSQCGTTEAKAYIKVLGNNLHQTVKDTIVICRHLELSRSIQLNQLLGIELSGTWSYPDDPGSVILNNVDVIAAPSKYAGARIFNAQKAWSQATHTNYDITYKTDSNAKQFKFRYTTSTECGGPYVREFVIVVTDTIL